MNEDLSAEGEDVTEQFLSACKELNLGELCKNDGFNLSDAMSAIEILDPKMDMGIEPFDDNLGLSEAVKNKNLNVSNVLLTDLIATIDATLSMISCWLNGQSLDQTVYTNICLLELDVVKDPVLFGFSFAALNLLKGTKMCIELAGVFNEEDYSSYTYNSKLNFHFDALCPELDTAIEILRLKKSNKDELKLIEAVEARLCFLQSIFELFSYLFSTSENMVPNFKKASFTVDRLLVWMRIMIDTISFGSQPPEEQDDSDFSWLPFFQPQINCQFFPASFPRVPKLMNRVESLKYFNKFLKTVKRMIIELPEKMRDLEGLLNFLQTFGSENNCLLSRSLAQLLIMPNDHTICGLYPLTDIIYESLRQLDSCLSGNNAELSLLIDPTIQDKLQNFILFLVKAFIGVFQMFGHNVARQRDKLLRNSFEDFALLQSLANEIELERWNNTSDKTNSRQSSVLSNFLLFYILKLMHYHMDLGYRLDLFVPYEYSYVYWYLGEIVSKNLAALLERRCSLLVLNYSRSIAVLDNKKPNKKQQLKQRAETELRKNITQMQSTIFFLKIDMFLSYAFIKFAIGLKLSGRLKIPAGEQLRYEQRFETYSGLAAMLCIPYEMFINSSGIDILEKTSATRCFSEANKHFEEAISFFKNLESQNPEALTSNIKPLIKISKQNAIVSKLLASSTNLNKKIIFDVTQCERRMFPVIKLI